MNPYALMMMAGLMAAATPNDRLIEREPDLTPRLPEAARRRARELVDAGDWDGADAVLKPYGYHVVRPEPVAVDHAKPALILNEKQARAVEKRARRAAKRLGVVDEPEVDLPDGECSCFSHPPCAWCSSLTEEQVALLERQGRL